MHILIAPNAFKNTLPADAAASAILEGLEKSRLVFTAEQFPIGDGGDGTGHLIVTRLRGKEIACFVKDPLGRQISATVGYTDDGRTAIVEMSDASGLKLVKPPERKVMQASSYGTGELIRCALDQGIDRLILCIGGSATTDGGSGILTALGLRMLDESGNVLNGNPDGLLKLARLDLSGLDTRIFQCDVTILCDVDNKLLGPEGAAAVFSPQKGADAMTVEKLERALQRWAIVTQQQTGKQMSAIKHGGAAGGTAAGLAVFLNARLVTGIDYFLERTDFQSSLNRADLLITAEGSIDEQTLNGKGPFGVAMHARKKGIPVIGLAGKVPAQMNPRLQAVFDVLLAIGEGPAQIGDALARTRDNLIRTSTQIGNLLAWSK